jgi:hypothetical protein
VKALEIRAEEIHFRLDEWNNGGETCASLAVARLVWIGSAGDLLAVELDATRHADGVSFLPAPAGLRARGGRVGGAQNEQFPLDALTARFCFVIRGIFADLVDFRGAQ